MALSRFRNFPIRQVCLLWTFSTQHVYHGILFRMVYIPVLTGLTKRSAPHQEAHKCGKGHRSTYEVLPGSTAGQLDRFEQVPDHTRVQ